MLGRLHGWKRPSPEQAQTNFDARLETCKPALFDLAGQLLAAYPDRGWNLFIGDDTSGRLPARFVRQVFAQSGVVVPTRYIAASRSVSGGKPRDMYDQYAKRLVTGATDNARGLIITESAGETLGSLRFTHELLAPHCETLDTAIVASRGEPTPDLGVAYLGAGVGDEKVLNAVWKTFEHPLQTRKGEQWSGALTNLARNPDPERGDATVAAELTYRGLAHYCYGRMDELAAEFLADTGGVLLQMPDAATANSMHRPNQILAA